MILIIKLEYHSMVDKGSKVESEWGKECVRLDDALARQKGKHTDTL